MSPAPPRVALLAALLLASPAGCGSTRTTEQRVFCFFDGSGAACPTQEQIGLQLSSASQNSTCGSEFVSVDDGPFESQQGCPTCPASTRECCYIATLRDFEGDLLDLSSDRCDSSLDAR